MIFPISKSSLFVRSEHEHGAPTLGGRLPRAFRAGSVVDRYGATVGTSSVKKIHELLFQSSVQWSNVTSAEARFKPASVKNLVSRRGLWLCAATEESEGKSRWTRANGINHITCDVRIEPDQACPLDCP